ncbi:RadC family protein [Alkalicoccus luteus]|uniref:DNA repair protein RadC n=1 Tax=Alkalicoccus luteus TaxID=1237094 RepID=A0A969PTT0_9BACI|nr:DNA repair protein RadC [Alkalicoccus luteus]NJP38999.1 DNA repair protein RadC [Alkalicoccus luteus]
MENVFEILKIKQVITERALVEKGQERYVIRSPQDAATLLTKEIGDEDREVLMVLMLNTKNEVLALHRCHVGTLDSSVVHPREVYKGACLNNAYAILVAHQHPSGFPQPSAEDFRVTQRLREAGKILGIELIDHIIVTANEERYVSLKEQPSWT